MKKILSLTAVMLSLLVITGVNGAKAQQVQNYKITPKAPVVSDSIKPAIAKYKSGDYTGAMIELEEILKKEKRNTTAKYYLALCYTKLGYRSEAEGIYNEIVELNDNMTLVYYSKRALNCIDNPDGDGCSAKKDYTQVVEKQVVELDDMTKFIRSGQQFHPSVRDQITKDRMERRIQQEEYSKKQNSGDIDGELNSQAPTNEEIASALNTLSKIGMNPYDQRFSAVNLMSNPYQYAYLNQNPLSYPAMLNSNPETAKMMLYSQLNRQLASQFTMPQQQNYNYFSGFGL